MNSKDIDTTPMPFNYDLEASSLGSIIAYGLREEVGTNSHAFKFLDITNEDMFYNATTKAVYRIIKALCNNGDAVHIVSVNQMAIKQGLPISEVQDIISRNDLPVDEVYNKTIPQLQEYSSRRQIYGLSSSLKQLGTNLTLDFDKVMQDTLNQLQEISNNSAMHQRVCNGSDVLKNLIRIYDKNLQGISELSTMTGFKEIDDIGGLFASDFIIIGASTSVGKSAFSTSLILHALSEHKKVAMYNLEMTNEQVMARLIAPIAEMRSTSILRSKGDEAGMKKLENAVIKFDEMAYNLLFDDNCPKSLDKIVSSIRYFKRTQNLTGAIIDYLGLIEGQEKNESKEQFMARCARRLKNLCLELNIWIIALVQFNRDDNSVKPNMNRFRDSGQIGEASDIAILIWRPEKTGGNYEGIYSNVQVEGTAEIIMGKNRNGEAPDFIVGFDGESTRFYSLDKVPTKAVNVKQAQAASKGEPPMPF